MDLHFEPDRLLLWIVLIPLFGALINGLGSRFAPSRGLVTLVGVGSIALSFLLGCYFFMRVAGMRVEADHVVNARITYTAWEWFSVSIGDFEIPIQMRFVF